MQDIGRIFAIRGGPVHVHRFHSAWSPLCLKSMNVVTIVTRQCGTYNSIPGPSNTSWITSKLGLRA